jgi:hypothetical protein
VVGPIGEYIVADLDRELKTRGDQALYPPFGQPPCPSRVNAGLSFACAIFKVTLGSAAGWTCFSKFMATKKHRKHLLPALVGILSLGVEFFEQRIFGLGVDERVIARRAVGHFVLVADVVVTLELHDSCNCALVKFTSGGHGVAEPC